MNKTELHDKYKKLYQHMETSGQVSHMKTFGNVMNSMMYWMIENKPECAEIYIESLCAVKWEQYLTKTEAQEITSSMSPSYAWDFDSWYKAMNSLNLETESLYIFNKYALWVVMNSIHSDNGKVISDIMGLGPVDSSNPEYIRAIHKMAINLLKDEDSKYRVRNVFLT